MKWVPVQALAEMSENEIIAFSLEESAWILIRKGNEVSAFVDVCSHQAIKLSEFGEIQQGVLVCHAHGAAFDCRDGKELGFPASSPLQQVPVRVTDGLVEIQIS
jgi:nitrite reductase/ring-hydroxylating ferredoxin subunit